jgi:hypothetical protein
MEMKNETSKSVPRSFKPWPENQKRLEYAQQIGLEVSNVVNELLSKYLKSYLEKEKAARAAVFNAPVP